jgi:YD repeat-containing protein
MDAHQLCESASYLDCECVIRVQECDARRGPHSETATIIARRAGSVVAPLGSLRKLLAVLSFCCLAVLGAAAAGPVMSGAILLLAPNLGVRQVDHDLPDGYQPFHKGHVSTATGLYVREDEDIVLRGTPPLILRRTYLSNYRASKEFGVGTTHPGEWYVIGDGERFQWAALILADGARVQFERVSSGTSFFNALYEHHASPGEWQGARFGWTGLGWALRRTDGTLAQFRGCGEGSVCSLMRLRDSDGHTIRYRRDLSGRLLRMEASADRWIGFDYDVERRVTRAYSSAGDDVRYDYDERGRLAQVAAADGTIRRYTYTDQDLMATMEDPGHRIENVYDADGRCIRQANWYAGQTEPFTFTFAYVVRADAVVETRSTQSDGSWSRYTFGENRYTSSETWGTPDVEPTTIVYDRDPRSTLVTGLTVTCPDRTGRLLRHETLVKPGWEEWTRWDLLQTHCSGKKRPAPRDEAVPAVSLEAVS